MKTQVVNPYLPSYEYVPDGEPYVFGERVYIYGSHDRFNGDTFCENDYVGWSASIYNLSDWKYEGIIYRRDKDPIWKEGNKLFAPDVQQGKDGRYYLYYALDFKGVISVAVCETPMGEYEFYGHVRYSDGTLLGSRENDGFQYDPALFIDDDHKVYLYSGFCPIDFPWKKFGTEPQTIKGGMVIELEPDMLTVKTDPEYIFPDKSHGKGTSFEGHEFFEAPSMRKINGIYYFLYSSTNGHELCYATSKFPNKDFVFGGTVISNGDIYFEGRKEKDALNYTGTNHGSVIKIKGQWYIFYHRQTNNHPFSRQGCAEKISIESDGSIKQVEMTSCGLNNGPLIGRGEYFSYIACNLFSKEGALRYSPGNIIEYNHPFFTQEGEDRETNPNQYIANLQDGAVAGFKYFYCSGTYLFSVKVRGEGKGYIHLRTHLKDENLISIPVQSTNEWKEFSMHASINLNTGTYPLYFIYEGGGAFDFYSFIMK